MNTSNGRKFWEDWSPPADLRRSAPRPVQLTASGIGILVLAAAMAAGGIAAAIALRVEARHTMEELRAMQTGGADTEGVVTRLWKVNEKEQSYLAEYHFSVNERDYRGRRRLARSHWNRLQTGSPIAVRYLASDPKRNFPADDPPRPTTVWLPIGVATVFFFIAGMVIWMILGARRLLADGRAAPGVVTANQRVSNQHGSQNMIRYEFRTAGGSSFKGRANRAKMAPGTVICVVYNPDNPRRNAPYPFHLVKVARY